ncbi:hypothetical protein [Saccharothrix algeriensis]|uniref:Uncharacterized protein n=1 Tax=Saccharothrix algeriensis TaxID=173560 RepID=A0ABS2SD64_9PSEU|nr:hypothetical protein [Saccharothrix algeriensis]MBM7813248.1 hypothetical protein [Saccharothrix algeriensis]
MVTSVDPAAPRRRRCSRRGTAWSPRRPARARAWSPGDEVEPIPLRVEPGNAPATALHLRHGFVAAPGGVLVRVPA